MVLPKAILICSLLTTHFAKASLMPCAFGWSGLGLHGDDCSRAWFLEQRMANMERRMANMVKWEVEKQLESTDAVNSLVSDMKRQVLAGIREQVEREVQKQVAIGMRDEVQRELLSKMQDATLGEESVLDS